MHGKLRQIMYPTPIWDKTQARSASGSQNQVGVRDMPTEHTRYQGVQWNKEEQQRRMGRVTEAVEGKPII